jgi:hypothetical protein
MRYNQNLYNGAEKSANVSYLQRVDAGGKIGAKLRGA